jgi:hypoxanthine-guanine phosphoribosyltransferase
VKIKDKTFQTLISEAEIKKRVKELAESINHDMKDKNGAKIDPSHLYIIGFWSYGNKPIVIDKITLE